MRISTGNGEVWLISPGSPSHPGWDKWPWKMAVKGKERDGCLMELLLSSSSSFSVAQSCLTLRPHGLRHAELPCPSPSPGVCSNSCPSSQWCHPTISSSVIPFSSCLQSFLAWGPFPMSWLFTSSGQNIGASASVLPVYSALISFRNWIPLGLTGLISLLSKRLSGLLQHHSLKASILWHSALYIGIFEHVNKLKRRNL